MGCSATPAAQLRWSGRGFSHAPGHTPGPLLCRIGGASRRCALGLRASARPPKPPKGFKEKSSVTVPAAGPVSAAAARLPPAWAACQRLLLSHPPTPLAGGLCGTLRSWRKAACSGSSPPGFRSLCGRPLLLPPGGGHRAPMTGPRAAPHRAPWPPPRPPGGLGSGGSRRRYALPAASVVSPRPPWRSQSGGCGPAGLRGALGGLATHPPPEGGSPRPPLLLIVRAKCSADAHRTR
jgi:hypothetical protein